MILTGVPLAGLQPAGAGAGPIKDTRRIIPPCAPRFGVFLLMFITPLWGTTFVVLKLGSTAASALLSQWRAPQPLLPPQPSSQPSKLAPSGLFAVAFRPRVMRLPGRRCTGWPAGSSLAEASKLDIIANISGDGRQREVIRQCRFNAEAEQNVPFWQTGNRRLRSGGDQRQAVPILQERPVRAFRETLGEIPECPARPVNFQRHDRADRGAGRAGNRPRRRGGHSRPHVHGHRGGSACGRGHPSHHRRGRVRHHRRRRAGGRDRPANEGGHPRPHVGDGLQYGRYPADCTTEEGVCRRGRLSVRWRCL